QRWHLDRSAESCLRERDGQLTVQILRLANKERMPSNPKDAVQVAGRRSGTAPLTFALQPESRISVHTWWNVYIDWTMDLDLSRTVTLHAGAGDDAAPAPARIAGLLDPKEPLPLDQHPMPAAAPAGRRLRAWLAAAAPAILAEFLAGDLHG